MTKQNDFSSAAKAYVKAQTEIESAQSSVEHARATLESAERRFCDAKEIVFDEGWLGEDRPIRTAVVGERVVVLQRDGHGISLTTAKAEV